MVRAVPDVAGLDMGDGEDNRRIIKEVPLGEVSPPPETISRRLGIVSIEEYSR